MFNSKLLVYQRLYQHDEATSGGSAHRISASLTASISTTSSPRTRRWAPLVMPEVSCGGYEILDIMNLFDVLVLSKKYYLILTSTKMLDGWIIIGGNTEGHHDVPLEQSCHRAWLADASRSSALGLLQEQPLAQRCLREWGCRLALHLFCWQPKNAAVSPWVRLRTSILGKRVYYSDLTVTSLESWL